MVAGRREGEQAYISGSFCVSMTAAIGMPKLETGPQKSVRGVWLSAGETVAFGGNGHRRGLEGGKAFDVRVEQT